MEYCARLNFPFRGRWYRKGDPVVSDRVTLRHLRDRRLIESVSDDPPDLPAFLPVGWRDFSAHDVKQLAVEHGVPRPTKGKSIEALEALYGAQA